MADSDQQNPGDPTPGGEQDWMKAYMGDSPAGSSLAGRLSAGPRMKKKGSPLLLILVAVLGVVVAVLLMRNQNQTKAMADSDDLGAGISNASGLRGHLVTRWQKDQTQYQLKIEPIDPREASGFAVAAANPPEPIAINVRVLDSSGFALCGKEILVPYSPSSSPVHPAKPGKQTDAEKALAEQHANEARMATLQQAKQRGADVFTNIRDSDGKIEALWAQGVLPCSPDQYRKFDYWDLVTNFPTIAVQEQLMNPGKHLSHEELQAEERKTEKHTTTGKKLPPSFLVQGDDWITGYEPARGLLIAGPGKSFFIVRKSDEATVAGWAADSSLIHFKCDQHASCAINRAGSSVLVPARLNE